MKTGIDPFTLESVHDFWNVEACGTHFVDPVDGDFFRRYCEYRYRTLWYIPELIPFSETSGRDVLEIGCGVGADGVRFARQGANYTGVDLTETAVETTRRHFDLLGLSGTFRIENAERLSFPDRSFDLVYSLGVLHHTPHPERAIAEVHRVLRPGGRAVVMLYHKRSFNYYVRIQGYMRGRILLRILSRAGRWKADREAFADHSHLEVRGNADLRVWDAHYKHFLDGGWRYLKAANLVHHCTDGPECPCAFVYTKKDARRAFAAFPVVDLRVAHFPLRQYSRGLIPGRLERLAAARLGWNLIVDARKQAA